MARLKVLIAGGGIGGITAMLALRQRGIDVLFEQAAAFGQVGAGIQVSSNAARILLKLGLGESLKRVATYPEGRDYRGWDIGERLYYTPLGQKAEAHFGSPYYAAHRAELLDVLLSGLGEHGFRLGSRVERVDQDQSGVSLTLADGSIAQGDILIGYMESPDFARALRLFAQSRDEFDVWFKRRMGEVTGADLSKPPKGPLSEQLSNYSTGKKALRTIANQMKG